MRLLDRDDPFFAGRRDREEIEEPAEVEELSDLARDAAEHEPAPCLFRPLRGEQEHTEAGAADVLELAQVEDQAPLGSGEAWLSAE